MNDTSTVPEVPVTDTARPTPRTPVVDATPPKDQGPKRKHGKGFIYMSLKDADDALRKIDHHAKTMSKEGFARALGHDAPTGRFLLKLDALKQYGLIEIDSEAVKLTPLATDMLYGGSEAVRTKARTTAFLACEDFKRAFVECPKNQDHPMAYLLDFVKGKLGIANEVDKFHRLFLESIHFAGLLEGEVNMAAKSIRLRPVSLDGASATPNSEGHRQAAAEEFVPLPPDSVDAVLEGFGLTAFRDRSELAQRAAGAVTLTAGEGKITVEIQRPVRVTIRAMDLLTDLPAIIQALRQKGLEA